jgi:nucleoside-diphosphate-sugar epimerase
MEEKKKKILVVGGTGVISFAVVKQALSQGFDVTCINRGKTKTQKLPEEVKVLIADYHNKCIIEKKLDGLHFDAVIDVLCYKETDIEYSVMLFKDKCDQYVFFSSCAVYNKGKGDYTCTEDSELINPVWNYSINKVRSEQKLVSLSQQYGFNYTIVRPAVTYGNTRIPYGITPPYGYHGTLIQRIINHKPIILWDNGEAYSTITHVDDFAVGMVGLLGNPKAYNTAFHIVGDYHYHWRDVILTLGKILDVQPIFFNLTKEEYAEEIPKRRGELLGGRGISQLLDNSKLKCVVPDFKTTISLEEGLKRTVHYYQTNNYLKGIDWIFDADTDRIIKKWCKNQGIDWKKYNLGFVNYLGTATLHDRMIYWREFNKENCFVRLINFALRTARKIKKSI